MDGMTTALREAGTIAVPGLDPVQERIASRPPLGRPLLVVGAPGTGKTTTAVAALIGRLARDAAHGDGGAHVLLAPSRRAAARCRRAVADWQRARGPHATRWLAVQTPAAFALSVLRALAVAQGREAPTLITGAEQDRMLAELLAGHAAAGVRRWPDSLPPESLALPAFRAELRDLFMRAAEFGLSPADLAERGRQAARPEWVAAATLLGEYRDVVSLADLPVGRGERYDSASVLGEAATVLADWEDFTDAPPPVVASIMVDDHQESSAATVRLLHAAAARGAHLTLFGDPDVAVQAFRGARPHFVERAERSGVLGGFGAEVEVLPVVHRGGERLRELVVTVSSRVPTAGVAMHRLAGPDPAAVAAERLPGAGDEPVCVEFASPRAEQEWIARTLRAAHLHDGKAWHSMAVIVRTGSLRRTLAAALRSLGVPVRDERPMVLRDEPAVRPLLLACLAAREGLTADAAAELVGGPLGGLDSLGLRRLRRALRTADSTPGEALLTVLADHARAAALPAAVGDGVVRVARVLAAARAELGRPGASHETLLWEAWQATGWGEVLRERALAGGPGGQRADDDLDAVIALFAAAERHAERHPGADPAEFVRRLLEEDIPTDTLAPRGGPTDVVQVLTAAEAAGQEWDLVIVAGVQEDVWPDVRLRDSLLGAGHLVDLELGRIGLSAPATNRSARADVLADEWRTFTAAVSRATRRLVVTAVRDGEQRPSEFFEVLGAAVRPPAVTRLDLRGAVAALRAELDADPGRQGAATLLAVLARVGVPGADPAEWAGSGTPTTLAPVARGDGPVRISPSRVETVSRCPLRWALEGAGGRRAEAIGRTLGTLVHGIAADHPHGTREELLAALDQRFASLGIPPGWLERRTRREAEAMLTLFADYAAGVPGEVRTEVEITQRIGDAVVHGFVDRLEVVDGGVRVVDLKTGTPRSMAEAEVNPQLGLYQLALRAGGEQTAGARLVHVTPSRRSIAERPQPPLPEGEGWVRHLLASAVDAMRGGTFAAVSSEGCRHCPVRRSCPVSGEGERCAR